MSKTREQLRQNLNVYLSDQGDLVWAEPQKNLSINLAIQAAWPDIKTVATATFTLASASYNYVLTALTRCAEWGPSQVWCATSSASVPVYRELRHNVIGHRDGSTYRLEFDKTFVSNRGGYRIKVYYDQQYGELSTDAATTDVPEAFLMPRAAFELCNMITLGGHHRDLDAFAAKSVDFFEVSERERARHQVLPLARVMGLRWE